MREGTIADGGTGDRREPAIEEGVVQRQRSEHRQLVLREVIHDLVRVVHILLLLEIALDETLHAGDVVTVLVTVKQLQIDRREVMIGVGIELALVFRERLDKDLIALRVRIALGAVEAVDLGVYGLERSQHVIE